MATKKEKEDKSLDDMLLAVAGRTKGSDVKRSSGKRPAKDSSSEDEKSDNGKKGSKMPLKKRFDTGDKDADERGGDEYDSDISYGSDLYRNEEDKKTLESMSELQREMELTDRAEKRENYIMRKKARSEQQKQKNLRDGPPSSRMRSAGRDTNKSAALNELVARRQKAHDTDQQRKRTASSSSSQQPQQQNQEKPRRSGRSMSPSSAESESEDEDEESSRESNRSEASDDERGAGDDDDMPDTEDIRSITIRRSKLFKWFMEPFFEQVIVGCLVRIGVGTSSSGESKYRLGVVKSIETKEPYKFENKMTHKYLNCVIGASEETTKLQMVRASDQIPTDEEISEWKEAVGSSTSMITRDEIKEKKEAMESVTSFVYSAAAVKQMIKEKKMVAEAQSKQPLSIEREKLMKDLAMAEVKNDEDEVKRLTLRIKELEANNSNNVKKSATKNEKAERIEMMNRRNRFENFRNASDTKPQAQLGEAGYDPFSRRWTRSQSYYNKQEAAAEAKEEEGLTKNDGGGGGGGGGSGGGGGGGGGVKVGGQVSSFKYSKMFGVHDFDVPINLATIEAMKGAQGAAIAFINRKRSIEGKYSVRVDESNDGRRHSLTLTVNDYKRRRGLL